jgi:hypothetical protein
VSTYHIYHTYHYAYRLTMISTILSSYIRFCQRLGEDHIFHIRTKPINHSSSLIHSTHTCKHLLHITFNISNLSFEFKHFMFSRKIRSIHSRAELVSLNLGSGKIKSTEGVISSESLNYSPSMRWKPLNLHL